MASEANGYLSFNQKIVEAFYHKRLGAVLICATTLEVPKIYDAVDIFYYRTPCDGDPAYLAELEAFLKEHHGDGRKPTFSAN